MRSELAKVFDENLSILIEELDTETGLLQDLLSKGVILAEQKNVIEAEHVPMNRTDKLCQFMKKRDDSDFDRFWNILRTRQPGLVDRILRSSPRQIIDPPNSGPPFDNKTLGVKIKKCFPTLTPSFDPKGNIIGSLFANEIITIGQMQEINNQATAEQRANALFNILFTTQHPKRYIFFCEALKIDYKWLVDIIDETPAN